MNVIIEFLKEQFRKEPARYIAYGSAAAIAGVVKLSELLGSPLSADSNVALAVGTIATFIITEVARRFVYSPATVEVIAERSADTGIPQVPPPPASDLPG